MTDTAVAPAPERVTLPRRPELPQPQPFPVLASLAPVIGSLVIWAITSSPFALVFAFLGPVIAVGTMIDGRVNGRRSLAKGRVIYTRKLAAARAAIERAQLTETRELARAHPGALEILRAAHRDPERWRSSFDHPVEITLGWSMQASRLRVEVTEDDDAGAGDGRDEQRAVLVREAALVRAPVVADARLGIGIVGGTVVGWAFARGLAAQLANLLPPEGASWQAAVSESDWLEALPHAGSATAPPGELSWSDGSGRAVICVAATINDLPHGLRVVVEVGGREGARVLAHPTLRAPVLLQCELVSLVQAAALATRLADCALGRPVNGGSLPASVPLSTLNIPDGPGVLEAAFLVGPSGVLVLDLVADGPHAVVGGTTGSGKSELLLSWLLSIALHSSPELVNFLLVDFKGGASFGPIVTLPHVVGLVTDLDERSAYRALSSLRAEVRFRELRLAAAGARSIDELTAGDGLPRLVIVVDEFAALVGGFPDLNELFADLAARGRSLGIHLILCTQRPSGVVRDSVLANIPMRLSLRVNNEADSTAVIGTAAASMLPVTPAGRAIVALAGEAPVTVQVALAAKTDSAAVSARWKGSAPPRRPWCDDLPREIGLTEGAAGSAFVLGLADYPAEQRQATALWDPAAEGSVIVLGATRSGKSECLSLLAAQGAEWVPHDSEGAWDSVEKAVTAVRRGTARPGVLLIDDVDALVGRFGDDHDAAFIDLLSELLRTGGSYGINLAMTARRLPSRVQALAAACDRRLLLRHANRQDYLLAGGDTAFFAVDIPPGRGEWGGAALQLATAPPTKQPAREAPPLFEPTATTVLISPRPGEFSARYPNCSVVELRPTFMPSETITIAAATQPTVVVGDADSWQANWSQLTALRSTSTMIFEHSTVADFRIFSGSRQLPPPLAQHSGSVWMLEPGHPPTRVRLADRPV